MSRLQDAWAEAQRRRFERENAHLYIRHDAWRFMPPGAPRWHGKDVVNYYRPEAQPKTDEQKFERYPLRTSEDNDERPNANDIDLARARWQLAALRVELALIKHALALRRKANFNPDQPRVPAGNPDGGQWTSEEGDGTGRDDPQVLSDATPDNNWMPGAQYAQLNSPPETPPEVPGERPASVQDRHRIARQVAKWGGRIGVFFEIGAWLYEHYPAIQSYRDPPKTLEELQQAVTNRTTPGYEDHHIVGQAARKEMDKGFPGSWIDAPENVVRVPKFKHWEINGWYERPNRDDRFRGLSPREYLRDKDWSERYQIGLEALIEHKVLKP